MPLDLPTAERKPPRPESRESFAPDARVWYPRTAARQSGSWPVLLYYSGWDGTRIDNMAVIRALVAHGFAVVTIIYPARTPGETRSAFRRRVSALRRPMDFSSDQAFEDSMNRAVDRVRARARDASMVLGVLESAVGQVNLGRLAQRMDLASVGIFGYSLGGAVAAEAAWMDARFRAVANLDGWQFAEAAQDGIAQPYLLLGDSTPLPTPAQLHARKAAVRNEAALSDADYRRTVRNMTRDGGIYAVISGTTHASLCDAGPRWPLRVLIRSGLIEPPRILQIVSTCLTEFFTQYLGGGSPDLVSRWAVRFPELKVKVYPVPSAPASGQSSSQWLPGNP